VPNPFDDQQLFMQACGQTTDRFNAEQFDLYVDLMSEEYQELTNAIKQMDKTETLDALIDILVVTIGAIHSMGADAGGAWQEVMRTNLAKIDPVTGRVNRRQDGKILKPPGWQPPQLESYVRKSS
jgi:predicted HAD superfamily Cof-like phosphohydrolase